MAGPAIEITGVGLTADGLEPATLELSPGLNLLYGGSNAGKSFILQVVDFMLGAKDLPLVDEALGYERAYLGMRFHDGRETTLRRAVKGGDFNLMEEAFAQALGRKSGGAVLAAEHGKGGKNGTSLSEVLLAEVGFKPGKIITNKGGKLASLSFRNVVDSVVVQEWAIMSKVSPVMSGDKLFATREQNVFRLLLTGSDDSSVVVIPAAPLQRASKSGKVELLDGMIQRLRASLEGAPSEDEATADLEAAEDAMENLGAVVAERQVRLDAAVSRRRELLTDRNRAKAEFDGIKSMLFRFEELDKVYASDLRRLEGIEEGGFLFQRQAGRPCPLCGAGIEHQHAPLSTDAEAHQRAAAAEMRKIRSERADLAKTRTVLEARGEGLAAALDEAAQAIKVAEAAADAERPGEASIRRDYERVLETRAKAQRIVDAYGDLKLREAERASVKATKVVPRKDLVHGINGPTGHMFAEVCKDVLEAWRFPNVQAVSFDTTTQDIAVNGRPRANNGKGVRAILHSAFKVALAIYCADKNLPHPGFVFLDSPLQTYRKPILAEDALADDEKALQATDLNARFYEHLASLKDVCQFLVIENTDPPANIAEWARVQRFAGEGGTKGRVGFVPSPA